MRDRPMQVTFVDSVQGHQTERLREIADRLRKQRSDVQVNLVEGDDAKRMLETHKLKFGPAVVIDGRLEYVGVPRWRFLQERIAQVVGRIANPRSVLAPGAAPKPAVAPRAVDAGAAPPPA